MGFLGRESEAEVQRIAEFKAWLDARSKPAVLSVCAGALSIVDCWTMLIGVAAGLAAIGLGVAGRREIQRNPGLKGRRLSATGVGLGLTGMALSAVMYFVVYPSLSS